ncbi:MAG TPA: hypothetical protein VF834_07360, partial [Streptosporangiaceae bacterium]
MTATSGVNRNDSRAARAGLDLGESSGSSIDSPTGVPLKADHLPHAGDQSSDSLIRRRRKAGSGEGRALSQQTRGSVSGFTRRQDNCAAIGP